MPSLLALAVAFCAVRIATATNLVTDGSFEDHGVGWSFQGGYSINTGGAAQGSIYVGVGAAMSQNIATTVGESYYIRFAILDTLPTVNFGGNQLTFTVPTNSSGLYRWKYVDAISTAVAGTTTWLEFVGNASIDDVSIVALHEPLRIVTQPESRSVYEGGSVTFSVIADGGPPISYQWSLNGIPLDGATNAHLLLQSVAPSAAGNYSALLSNVTGTLESTSAALTVQDPPIAPVIVLQPTGDIVPAGYPFNLSVVAIGKAPLMYQWFYEGSPLADATNRVLPFAAVDGTNAGTYSVRVMNAVGNVQSLPATIGITNVPGGGYVSHHNSSSGTRALIFDYDGVTKLATTNYFAQLYAGASPTILRPIGPMRWFGTGPFAGYFGGGPVRIPDVPIGQTVYVQTRVWESNAGISFEDARARGGKWGISPVFSMASTAPPPSVPMTVPNASFSLRAGSPLFSTGMIEVNRRGVTPIEWKLTGASNSRYLIEKRTPPQSWAPMLVITNLTGTVVFTDTNAATAQMNFYRARLLD